MKLNIEIRTDASRAAAREVLEQLVQSVKQIEKGLHPVDEVHIVLDSRD